MTLRLTITNPAGSSYTATIKAIDVDENGEGKEAPVAPVDLAAGESTDITIWKGREFLIVEKP